MKIKTIKIINFKSFDELTVDIGDFNILVGDNGTGKSTLLEAIHLALTGLYRGKNINNNISQDLFNVKCVDKYKEELRKGNNPKLPEISIEVYFDECPILMGDDNSNKSSDCGFTFKILFDENNSDAYSELIKDKDLDSLPFEFYKCEWNTFARKNYTSSKNIEFKSAFLDSKISGNFETFSTKLIKNYISDESIVELNQKIRESTDGLKNEEIFSNISKTFLKNTDLKTKNISIGVANNNKSTWANLITIKENDIPYENIGTGNQCVLSTILSLENDSFKGKGIILIEEPENHLSGMSMNMLLKNIKEHAKDQQVIISTHSSYVLNKLGLDNLIMLGNKKIVKISNLPRETIQYFEKISGYDTLRFILCKKSILVEGDSDDLIIQRAYKDKFNKLPVEDGIEIITVGLSFKRFLQLASVLNLKVSLVTDNDGNMNKIKELKENFNSRNIHIYSGKKAFTHEELGICKDKVPNVNTLEPEIVRVNKISDLNSIFDTNYESEESMCHYMINNKTEVAWKIFYSNKKITYPEYINNAIEELKANE